MPRIDPFAFDDEAPRQKMAPKKKLKKITSAPSVDEALKVARKSPETFLAWMARVETHHSQELPDLLESVGAGLGESADRLFRKSASLAIAQNSPGLLRALMIAGAPQTREDGSQDLLSKAFSLGCGDCASVLLGLGLDAISDWEGRGALVWSFARSDVDLAQLAWFSRAERPFLDAQCRKFFDEGLALAYLREADHFSAPMAAWCAETAQRTVRMDQVFDALSFRAEREKPLQGLVIALDVFAAAHVWTAEDQAKFNGAKFVNFYDPDLCVWAWKKWGAGERGLVSGLFSLLSAPNSFVSEERRLACAAALLDAGASPLDEKGEGPSAIDAWPALATLFAKEERASLRAAIDEMTPQLRRKTPLAEPVAQASVKAGRRL